MLVTVSPQIRVTPQTRTVQAESAAATQEGTDTGVGSVLAHIVHLREEHVFALLTEEEHDCKSWICDTGATNHMSGSLAAFAELDTTERGTVHFDDDSMTEIEGRGVVEYLCKNGEWRSFAGVYFIPWLTANIISVGQLDEAGYEVHIRTGKMDIREPGGRLLARIERKQSRLYVLDVNIAQRATCLSARVEAEARRWHTRLGHVNMPVLRQMPNQELVRGMPFLEQVERVCEACMTEKQRHTAFPDQAAWRAEHGLELVHGDLCGPISPATPSGNSYFLLLVDDHSRYMWISTLVSKNQAIAAIMDFQARAAGESGHKLSMLRTDKGGDFTSKQFTEYCVQEGVQRQLTVPYFPQQNGVIERHNAMVVGAARSKLKEMGLPGWFWGEAVTTAVYLLNRVPCKAANGKAPFEVWYGKRHAVHHLKTFGCIVYVRNTKPHLKKLDDRGRKMIFVGYERGTKAYRAYDPVTKKVTITRDVVFDEDAQ
jgi:hypothetical protein